MSGEDYNIYDERPRKEPQRGQEPPEQKDRHPVASKVFAVLSFVFTGFGLIVALTSGGASVVPGFLAIISGLTAYALGARKLGIAAVVVAAVVMIFGVVASQGFIPGIEASDHAYPQDVEQQTGQ
ncbi:Hypothetical Protein RradSPS_0128 [Rubrobacter radiotolerans]|uniref:Uncharacterized protein n=1 Tax=Rubrobacter radiotolerans TaxID=42256 RepID=A0A023WZM9_RUBRA|nr:hypothetical protein [Rubrobacter radiotolerans]AHY45411.1 Hypothetical Protein RradSPS_0128 [Rubrobacter radiotolerans]MDX5892822.1 hypothetical protein [Rubrobacter radiotolerans]SMC02560.1 hypothetical protein SAMN00767673_0130 [Rubrobacter radiotolerans DSM 5868]